LSAIIYDTKIIITGSFETYIHWTFNVLFTALRCMCNKFVKGDKNFPRVKGRSLGPTVRNLDHFCDNSFQLSICLYCDSVAMS